MPDPEVRKPLKWRHGRAQFIMGYYEKVHEMGGALGVHLTTLLNTFTEEKKYSPL